MVPPCFKGGRGTFRCDLSELRFRQSGEEVWPRREKDSKPCVDQVSAGCTLILRGSERAKDADATDDTGFVLCV